MTDAAVDRLRPVVSSLRFVALLALERAAPGLTVGQINAAMASLGFERTKLGRLPFFVRIAARRADDRG